MLDESANKGEASVQVFALGTTFTITDRDTTDDPGLNDTAPPDVNVTAPNGGEIVDAGSSFTITWESSDDVGVIRHDVLLSTDGGSSFNPIVTELPGNAVLYEWFAPTIANNAMMRVRVLAYDAACNVGQADSEANFQIWNSGGDLPHVAEAPIYMSSGGFTSVIHLCNASASSVNLELAVRNRYGTALAGPPLQSILASGQVRAIDVANLLLPGNPPDPNVSMGSIRLRHNGGNDSEVRALAVVDGGGEDDSFTVPFVYLASSQLPYSTMQCSPLYYVDSETSALLALQNVTNVPVLVSVALHYGTGGLGTPNGIYYIPSFTLAPQQTQITNLASYASQLQGTNWGSITLTAPPQSVVAHTVMMSHSNHLAFNSAFMDPAMCSSVTKVASTLKLDYNMDMKACVMVCDTLPNNNKKIVTLSFKTDNGVALPSCTFLLGGGGPKQKLIELDSRALLAPGGSTMATVSMSYNGVASDVIAGAVSMSAANHCAIPAQFVEMHPTDGRHLVAPFFKFDERTSGLLQLTNFGTEEVKAGVIMKFADTTLPTLNTDLISVPAGGTTTVDLQSYFGRVDDTVTAEGCVEVIHNGASGTITATFTALGKYNDLSLVVPLEAGPAFPANAMEIFPNSVELAYGDATTFYAMTGEELHAPDWSVSSAGDPGKIAGDESTARDVYPASYYSSHDTNTFAVAVQADATGSGGPIQTGLITLAKVLISGFDTSLGGGRMNPDGGTSFTITGDRDWPDGPLTVRFKGSGGSIDFNVARSSSNLRVLTGVTQFNTAFIGDAQVIVLQDGTKISKDRSGAAYFAFDPPTSVASVSPDGFNRLGGLLTINGSGFRTFGTVLPDVNIDGIGFTTSGVNQPTQISGLVLRATNDIQSCVVVGQVPCKVITVKNPGHRNNDRTRSVIPIYNLKPGPPPVPQTRVPDFGPSYGGTQIVIRGQLMDFTDSVSVGGSPAVIASETGRVVIVTVPPHLAGTVALVVNDPDLEMVTVPGGYVYRPSAPLQVAGGPLTDGTYIVGPGEAVIDAGSHAYSADGTPNGTPWVRGFDVTVTRLTNLPPGVTSPIEAYTVDVTAFTISINTPPDTYHMICTFKIGNSAAPTDQNLWRSVTQRRSFIVH